MPEDQVDDAHAQHNDIETEPVIRQHCTTESNTAKDRFHQEENGENVIVHDGKRMRRRERHGIWTCVSENARAHQRKADYAQLYGLAGHHSLYTP
jgi:hypothetical protein